MSEPKLPTKKEIVKLPRWAVVAFAARCARRVLPLFQGDWPHVSPDHVAAVIRAIEYAEQAAADDAAARATAFADAARAADVVADAARATDTAADAAKAARAAKANGAASGTAAAAAVAVMVARATARASYGRAAVDAARAARATVDAATRADGAARLASAFAHTDTDAAERAAAYVTATDAAERAARAAVVRDFHILKALATNERWTDSSPVPPEVFGPLWPDGPPSGWPEQEVSSAGHELVLTLDLPEGMTDEEALDLVAGVVTRADDLDRAYGGHGLEVEEGNIDIDREVYAPVPVGGAS